MPSRSERSQQRKRARELERAMAELDRLDRVHGLGALPGAGAGRRAPRPHAARRRLLVSVGLSAVVLVSLLVLAPTPELQGLRSVLGLGGDRLDAAPVVPDGPGSFRFMQTQAQTRQPVGYDPCRVIQVEVNPEGAPDGYDRLVDTAIEHTGTATGLRFQRVGTTDRRPSTSKSGRRQPVLVAWATSDEVPALAGDVAGIGGSTAVEVGFRHREYVTGEVVLDSDAFDDVAGDEYAPAQAVVDHEFGHLVGLDHVDDRGELMYPESVGRTTYGPGDLEGLARLGNLPCT